MKPEARKASPSLDTSSTNYCHLNFPSTRSPSSISFVRVILILLVCLLFPSLSSSFSMRSVWQRRHLLSATVQATLKQQPPNHQLNRRGALAFVSPRLQPLSHPRASTSTATFASTTTRLFASTPSVMETDNTNTDGNEYTPYEKWVRRLYLTNLFHPVKMGLTNMRALHQLMGSPMDQVRKIEVEYGRNGWKDGQPACSLVSMDFLLTSLSLAFLLCSSYYSSPMW
jgi:hypothetical protein